MLITTVFDPKLLKQAVTPRALLSSGHHPNGNESSQHSPETSSWQDVVATSAVGCLLYCLLLRCWVDSHEILLKFDFWSFLINFTTQNEVWALLRACHTNSMRRSLGTSDFTKHWELKNPTPNFNSGYDNWSSKPSFASTVLSGDLLDDWLLMIHR